MRAVNKPKDIPSPLTHERCVESLKNIIKDRKKHTKDPEKIKSEFYRGNDTDANSTVYKLYEIYSHKCAYCEEERTKLDVEHYRPKGEIIEESSHKGYYWLCYEWSNLIIACKDCNRDWKTEHFSINGKRIFDKDVDWKKVKKELLELEELNKIEHPILLHPEEKDFLPEKFLKFNEFGSVFGIDCDGRGSGTIIICNLNRPDVRRRRKKIIDKINEHIRYFVSELKPDLSNKAEVIDRIVKLGLSEVDLEDEKIEYTLLHKSIFRDFDELVLAKNHKEFHEVITEAFKIKFKKYF